MFREGDQKPAISFNEIVGSEGIAVPWQIGWVSTKIGVTPGIIFIVSSTVRAQGFPDVWMMSGVKVYKVVVVLLIAGVHMPAISFIEVVGNSGMYVPEQNCEIGVNWGVTKL